MMSYWIIDPEARIPEITITKPLSFSAFKTGEECGLKLRFARAPKGSFGASGNSAAAIGSALHATLEHIGSLREQATTARDYCLALLNDFKGRVNQIRAPLAPDERTAFERSARERIDLVENGIIRVARDIFLNTGAGTGSNGKMEVPLTTPDGNFIGIIDRVDMSDGKVKIIDYKSSLVASDEAISRAREQIKFYAYLWYVTNGEWPSTGLAWFVSANVIDTIEIDSDKCSEISAKLLEFAGSLDSFNGRSDSELANPGNACRFCMFRPWCLPFWQHQQSANSLPALRVGLAGIVEDESSDEDARLMRIESQNGIANVRFSSLDFPHLCGLKRGTKIRLVDIDAVGMLSHPSILLGERSEAYIVAN